MQVEPTISDSKLSYFYNGCENLQPKITASFKSFKQNETVQKTTAAVKEYAPYVIGFVGSYFAPVAVTVGCLAITFVIAKKRPQYISMQTFGKVVMGVGGSMFLTAIKAGVSQHHKLIALAFASAVTYHVGKIVRDLPAKQEPTTPKQFYLYG